MATQTTHSQDLQVLASSRHFFATGQIPDIDANVRFREVYEQLSDKHGAFFLVENGERRHFVRARLLAEQMLRQAQQSLQSDSGMDAGASDEALRSAVAAICDRPIGEIVKDVWRESPVLPIHEMPAGVDLGKLWMFEDRVFDVVEADQHRGWYLNHETVRDATTDKTIFVCKNPRNPHNNIGPDHGTCSKCPYPLVKATSAN